MSKNRQALRDYFFAVTKDLLSRGVIRRQRGQLIDDVLKAEAAIVLKEVQEDAISVAKELGMTFAMGAKGYLENAAHKMLDSGIETGMKHFFDLLAGSKKKR